jgi:biopolymer transport protein ExbB
MITPEQNHLLDVLSRGGWIMVPLALCSIIALAVIVERILWGPRRSRVIPKKLLDEVWALINSGRLEEIIGLCRATDAALARIIISAVKNMNKPRNEIIEAIEMAGKKESARLERFLGILGTIAAIAPLLGLLGTVFGMIKTFTVIQIEGVGQSAQLAGGISEALITTATGLTIAIPTLIFYRYFLHEAKKITLEMEEISLAVIDELSSLNQQTSLDQKINQNN